MSADAPAGRGTAARRALPLVAIVAAALLAAALAGPGDDGRPLDPRSTAPSGTKALVDSLEALGAEVEVGVSGPTERTGRALILIDDLDEDERQDLLGWVARGGILVVADPRSDLAPEPIGTTAIGAFGVLGIAPDCEVAALADVGNVVPDPSAVVFEAPEGTIGCFPRNDGHWMVIAPRGEGAVVALGGQDVFLNARLGGGATPDLVAALLVPADGTVALLRTRLPGQGDAGLAELIGDNVSLAALQLLLALLVLIAWRSRRLGRPVEEPQPVAIPGSELVTAVGHLWQEADARGRAAGVLQGDVRRTLAQRLGLQRTASAAEVAEAAAARSGVDARELEAALSARVPDDPAALVALAHDLERLRRDSLSPPTPTTEDL